MASSVDPSILNPDNYKDFPFRPLPRIHALNSQTFRPPPLDASLTVPELYDWNFKHNPKHPLFVYIDDDGQEKTVYWSQAVPALHRAGRIVKSRLPADAPEHPFVALLCATDTITNFLTQIGILRAACGVFPISVRNSPAAVAHLLTKMNITHLLVGPETPYQELAAAAFRIMEKQGTPLPGTSTMLAFEDIVRDEGEAFEPLPDMDVTWDDPSIVQHSSGTTAFPKPIVWSHWRYLQWAIVPYYGGRDLTGFRLGIQGLPMYHGMGMLQIGWAASTGVVLAVFKPQVPAVAPTPENLIRSFVDTNSEAGFCVPVFIETWSKNPEYVEILKNMKGIMYGGAPLAAEVGEFLVNQGVQIWNMYGISEAGIMSSLCPPDAGKDFLYFKMADSVKAHLEDQGDGSAELVVLPAPHATPSVMNTVVNGVGAYATSDLLQPHPTKPRYYRILGRVDDQIMHNNGEKTNPGPLEAILNQDPHVQQSVIFGRGKFNAGVLVDPKPEFKFDPKDTEKLARFRNLIWPSVEKMNEFAPQHSRLFKEMILVTSPSKPFTYTAKLTPRRQAIINEYKDEIEALYAAADESAQAADNLATPTRWDLQETLSFIRKIVESVLGRAIPDQDDLFLHGCDSLQATWIRNSVLHALRDGAKGNTRNISGSFVYQSPTIAALARFVSDFVNGKSDVNASNVVSPAAQAQETVAEMLEMVQKYTRNFPKHVGSKPLPEKETILVTGTTGPLGMCLLSQLVEMPWVEHVFALNRKGEDGVSLFDRQIGRLREWGLDPKLVQSPKVTLLESDMFEDHLGLPAAVYEKIRTSATHIIHTAYRVNFKLSLASFETHARAARNIIDLALSSPHASPMKLIYTNSIGSLMYCPDPSPVKEVPTPPESAITSGYTQSKWVIERMLLSAQEYTTLRPVSVRVGQITGGPSGAWNTTEWFPALLKSSQYLKCLPSLDKTCSWLPVYAMAQALIDMRNSPYTILHLTHPHPISWSDVMTPISQRFGLPLVPFSEWMQKLRASAETAKTEIQEGNPALNLLEFYEHGEQATAEKEAMGLRTLDMSRAMEVAPALAKMKKLSEEDVGRWVSYWSRVGFLSL